jgi:hypothetical protein
MPRSPILNTSARQRLTVLGSALVLAAGVAVTLTATASASGTTSARPCSKATLLGTYSYGYEGWSVSKGTRTPWSSAGFDHFSGAGTSTGVTTYVSDGVVVDSNRPDTSTYTLRADCTGTITFKIGSSLARFNIYANPSGRSFDLIDIDGGSVQAGSETRVG